MIRIIISLCIMSIGISALADTASPQPKVHMGDVWEYQITDGFTNEVVFSPIRKIVAITDDEITVQLTYSGRPLSQRSLFFFNRDWNLKDNDNQKYDPYLPEFKFPLSVGDSWSKEYINKFINGSVTKSNLSAKVSAYEKVQTPAGEFDAYRIDCKIDTIGLGDSPRTFHDTHTVWYSPKVNGFVRREVTTVSEGRVRKKEITELVKYTPQLTNEH